MFLARLAALGIALSCAWIAPVAAQTAQDCADSEQLVALALHGFPGMEGKEKFGGKGFTLHELTKPVPGFKSCELIVNKSLSDGDPSVVCDVMKSADIEPIEGTQTSDSMKMWRETMNTLANDMARCLGVQALGPRPGGEAKEGREVLDWFVFVSRPALSTTTRAALVLRVDQPVAGAHLDHRNRIDVRLHVNPDVPRELAASFSKQAPARVSVADFESFAGLRRGARAEDVVRLYGEPNEIRPNKDRSTLYYEYARRRLGFSVGVDAASNKVEWISLHRRDVPDWLRRRGVKDAKINLLGLHRDEVVARLGKPESVSSGSYNWEIETAGGSLHLTLRCFDHDQGICTTMIVGWL